MSVEAIIFIGGAICGWSVHAIILQIAYKLRIVEYKGGKHEH